MIFFMPSKAEGFGECLYTCDNTYSDMQYLVSNPNVCKSSKCTPLKTHMTFFPIPSFHRRYTSSKFVDFPARSCVCFQGGGTCNFPPFQSKLPVPKLPKLPGKVSLEMAKKSAGDHQLRLVKIPMVYQGFYTSQVVAFGFPAINSITIDFKVASLPPEM